jgi:hypothetical protein
MKSKLLIDVDPRKWENGYRKIKIKTIPNPGNGVNHKNKKRQNVRKKNV